MNMDKNHGQDQEIENCIQLKVIQNTKDINLYLDREKNTILKIMHLEKLDII